MKIILGSGSPRRKELLSKYGINYEVLTSECDESIHGFSPEDTVKQLALRKANAVASQLMQDANGSIKEEMIIIGADTLVACDDEILGKPHDREDAKRMIRMIAGRRHQVYTGVALIKLIPDGNNRTIKEQLDSDNKDNLNRLILFAEKTDVIVKAMTAEEIALYVNSGECDDKAGAYAIQGIFAKYIEGFDGDYNNVVGLPADRVLLELWKLGYHLPGSNAKLVVTDIDGTLVKDSSPAIYPELIDTIKELRKKGILFCIASGRQYASIRTMFQEVAEDTIFLCENGAHVVYKGQNLHMKEMRDDYMRELLKELRTYGEDHCYVISTPEGSYLEDPCESFETLIRDSYHNKYEIVHDFLALGKSSIKIAIYKKNSIREIGENILIPKWRDRLKTCMAGEEWVDFMAPEVDKGNALNFLQEYFGVTKAETMVFGDNANDLGMLSCGDESYVVSNARPEIKSAAKYICPAYWHQGVNKILQDRIM